jgi:hypothetical protein
VRTKTVALNFRATPELKQAVEGMAKAQGLKPGAWMHAVVQNAVAGGFVVRQHVSYEVIEPKTVLPKAGTGKA